MVGTSAAQVNLVYLLRRALVCMLALTACSNAVARQLANDEKKLIGQTIANYVQRDSIRIEWTPFVEDFARNPIDKRIYCATLVASGKALPFMVKVVEEVDYRILAIQPEYVYVAKPKGFTEKLNNTTTLQFCQEAGYDVSEP